MAGGLHTAVDCFPPFYDGYMGAFQISQANETFAKEASKAIYGQQIYGREEAVSAFAAGPKTCAQCGTTRTPQWREGPKGPKTLCNACGVKRVRQMRTGSEGARKKAAKTPLVPSQEYAEAAVAADCAGPRDPTQRRPARRPTASKTAGKSPEEGEQLDWQEEEDDLSCRSSQEAGSADTGGHNSDSAEEVAWVPERHTQARHLPPSPMARAVGPECAAAVNLLSMSIREDALKQTAQPQQRSTSGDMLKDVPKINAASYAQMANSALKWSSHMPSHAEAQDLIQDALAGLPEEKHTRILAVKAELDSVSREAAAADAAVAAVAKILAMKQAAAIKARASAAKAAKRIHTFMQNLENEYGWGQQGLKRHRSFQ